MILAETGSVDARQCTVSSSIDTDCERSGKKNRIPRSISIGHISEGLGFAGQLGVSGADYHRTVQAGYSSDLLYILTLTMSKISILILLRHITPVTLHRRLAVAVGVFVGTWGVASFFASAFRCSLPAAWAILGRRCFNQVTPNLEAWISISLSLSLSVPMLSEFVSQVSFWTSHGILNILTEVSLVVLPIYTIWNVRIRTSQKWTIVGCFALRTVYVKVDLRLRYPC